MRFVYTHTPSALSVARIRYGESAIRTIKLDLQLIEIRTYVYIGVSTILEYFMPRIVISSDRLSSVNLPSVTVGIKIEISDLRSRLIPHYNI